MKKLLTILSFVLFTLLSYCQVPVNAPVVQRATAGNTVMDSRWMGQYNSYQPRYPDTLAANVASNLGIDSCGAIIFTYDVNAIWVRACNPKRWERVSGQQVLPDGVYSGGDVGWTQSGLDFFETAAIYVLNHVTLTSPTVTPLTLTPSDPVFNRIDLIGLGPTGPTVITGVPSSSPQEPSFNPQVFIRRAAVLVEAGALTPNITTDIIYDENLGLPDEWTATNTGGTVDFANTLFPYHLTIDASVSVFDSSNRLKFNYSDTVHTVSKGSLVGFIRLASIMPDNQNLFVQLYYQGNPVSLKLPFTGSGMFRNILAQYQPVIFSAPSFGASDIIFDEIRIIPTGGGAFPAFKLDFIQFQTGFSPTVTQRDFAVVDNVAYGARAFNQLGYNFNFTNGNFGIRSSNPIHTLTIGDVTNGNVLYAYAPDGQTGVIESTAQLNLRSITGIVLSPNYNGGNGNILVTPSPNGNVSATYSNFNNYQVGYMGVDAYNGSADTSEFFIKRINTGAGPSYITLYDSIRLRGVPYFASPDSLVTIKNGVIGRSLSSDINTRFGIEDNLGIQDRAMDMQLHSLSITNMYYGYLQANHSLNNVYDNANMGIYVDTSAVDVPAIEINTSRTDATTLEVTSGNISVTTDSVHLASRSRINSGDLDDISNRILINHDLIKFSRTHQIVGPIFYNEPVKLFVPFSDSLDIPSPTRIAVWDSDTLKSASLSSIISGISVSNIGSGYRLVVPNISNIKTLFSNITGTWDSTSNANGLTYKVDTTLVATRAYVNNVAGGGGFTGVTSVAAVNTNGFSFSIANPTSTPTITLSTSITGLLKGNGTAMSAATVGTDYSVGTSALATGILKSTTATGALSIAVSGTDYVIPSVTTLSSLASVGTMTTGSISTGFIVRGVTMTLGSDASFDTYYKSAGGVLTRIPNGTSGQFFGANTGAAPTWQMPAVTGGVASITGTANQVIASASTGAVTLSLPQSIAVTSVVQFGRLTLGGTAATSPLTFVTNTDATASAGRWYYNTIRLGFALAGTILRVPLSNDVAPTPGQILIGNAAGTYTVSAISSANNSFTVANAPGSITLGLNMAFQTLTDGATITWNAANGFNAQVTLGGTGRTLSRTNWVSGQTYTIKIIQDGTGNRTITTWPTGTKWPNGAAPTIPTTAGSYTIVSFLFDGTNCSGAYTNAAYQ